jgi:hypothetical protein
VNFLRIKAAQTGHRFGEFALERYGDAGVYDRLRIRGPGLTPSRARKTTDMTSNALQPPESHQNRFWKSFQNNNSHRNIPAGRVNRKVQGDCFVKPTWQK